MTIAEAVDVTIDAPDRNTPGQTYVVPRVRVYHKLKWGTPANPDPWVRKPNLHADQIIFHQGSQPSVATLSRDYGEQISRAHRETREFKKTKRFPKTFGWVKIDALLDGNQQPVVLFVGPMTRIKDDHAAGREAITCQGLKHVLSSVPILEAFGENHDHIGGGAPEDENIVRVEVAPVFNGADRAGPAVRANRSALKYEIDINSTTHEVHVFTNSGTRIWTAREILDYVAALAHLNTELRWKVVDDFGAGDDDPLAEVEPVIEQEGRSLLEVMHEAITAGGMGYTVEPWLEGNDDVVGGIIRLYTMHANDLVIGEGGEATTVKGNPRVFNLPEAAPWFRDVWELSDNGFDQTDVRGQRIRATRSVTNNAGVFPQDDVDPKLQEDWSAGIEAGYDDSSNKESEAWDAVFCRFKVTDDYTPTEPTEVGGIDPSDGSIGTQRLNHILGRRRTESTSLRFGAIHDGGDAEITHSGKAEVGYLITRDIFQPRHHAAQSNVIIRDDALGCIVRGGPEQNPLMKQRHDRVALTFGVDLDYRVHAVVGEKSERGFSRIQVIQSPSGRMSIVFKAIVHTGKDDAAIVEQADGVLTDFARLRQLALFKHARYAQAIELVKVQSRRLLFDLSIGVIVRVGDNQAATPVASLTFDLKRGNTTAQTFKPYAST